MSSRGLGEMRGVVVVDLQLTRTRFIVLGRFTIGGIGIDIDKAHCLRSKNRG